MVGTWNGNSNNSLVSTPAAPLFSIDVTTYVWQGFMEESTKGWAINGFVAPNGLERAAVDPWTGLAASGNNAVEELFLPGTVPTRVPLEARCGEAILTTAGFEDEHASWMAADHGWLIRAQRGQGVRGGPEDTATAYFYNPVYNPYGRSWGLLVRGEGCDRPSEGPSESIDPCAFPAESLDPSAAPVSCPPPSESTAPTEAPTEPPTEAPTEPPTPDANPDADARAVGTGAGAVGRPA